ncbi:hypothetical protein SAMN06265339_1240 [Desulfurobacterium pacificum]|uniref:General secretion pathway protein GspM n=1 Tax=Desulfurobacterium pacificum TaxID=240166 RepID=A0ABY1NN23_9BACT|nr:hypothetical protein [Desulfurobacterium pacificum]SMP14013.1 hypothetical protein SAMN06265339_1240 [Desulfurobacterium pacificum]
MKLDGLKFWLDEYLSNLDERQRLLILIAVPFAAVLLLFFLIDYPIVSAKSSCENKQLAFKRKVEKVKKSILEYETLKNLLTPVEIKAKAASQVDPSVFLKRKFEKLGVKVKNVKVADSNSWDGFSKLTLTVSFAESPLNSVARAIFEAENSRYYVKDSSIEISDEDGNGLVSGKVSFNFYRSKE